MYFTPVLESKHMKDDDGCLLIVSPVDYSEIENLAYMKVTKEKWEMISKEHTVDHKGKRIRGSVSVCEVNGGQEYKLKVKHYSPDGMSKEDESIEIDKAMFDVFRCISPICTRKAIYCIEHEGLSIKVDVYYNANNQPAEYCKVKIETDKELVGKPKLPFRCNNIITSDGTPEYENTMKCIFKKMWRICNKDFEMSDMYHKL